MLDTSASLLVRLRSPSDREAWDRFAEIYGPLLYQWTQRYHLQDHDACDVVQEVLTVVARDIAEFRYDPQRGSFRGWLRTILANQLHAFWRRRKRHSAGVGDSQWQQALAELEDPGSGLSQRWDREYEQDVMRRAMELLRDDFEATTWQAFYAVAVQDRKPDEVARELGISRNAVYIAKSRVLERLRQLLAGLLG